MQNKITTTTESSPRGKRVRVYIDTDGTKYTLPRTAPQYVVKSSPEFIIEWIQKNADRVRIEAASKDATKHQLEEKYPADIYYPFFSEDKKEREKYEA